MARSSWGQRLKVTRWTFESACPMEYPYQNFNINTHGTLCRTKVTGKVKVWGQIYKRLYAGVGVEFRHLQWEWWCVVFSCVRPKNKINRSLKQRLAWNLGDGTYRQTLPSIIYQNCVIRAKKTHAWFHYMRQPCVIDLPFHGLYYN